MLRWFLTFAWAAQSGCALAQGFVPPEAGKTVDESFRVSLRQELPQDCIAWHIQGVELDVIVALDKVDLHDRVARDAHARADMEALFRIAQNHAAGSDGCVQLAYSEVGPYAWIFDTGVAAGQAVVLDGRSRARAPYAVIRYFAQEGFGGHISYEIPGQRPFRGIQWWVR